MHALRSSLLLTRSLTHSLLLMLSSHILLLLHVLSLNRLLMSLHLLEINKVSKVLKLSLLSWTVVVFSLIVTILLFFFVLRIISLAQVEWLDLTRFLFRRSLLL